MQAKTRRVAVVGGNRIPFARSGGPYAEASNQDMLTAALDGLEVYVPATSLLEEACARIRRACEALE